MANPAREYMTLDAWKKAPKSGVILRKEFIPQIKAAASDPDTVEFAISTGVVDRTRDTIAVPGWKLDNYRNNPVVLWVHDRSQPPVGNSVREWTTDNALNSECKFVSRELYPFGGMIGDLVKAGFLHAVSVGFDPIKYAINEDRGGSSWCPPCDFLEQELLEYSIVTVPANPEALVGAKSQGIDLRPMIEHAERVLAQAKGPGIWLAEGHTREHWEKIFKTAGNGRKIFIFGQQKDPADGNTDQVDDDDVNMPMFDVGDRVIVDHPEEGEVEGTVRSATLGYSYDVQMDDDDAVEGPFTEDMLCAAEDDEKGAPHGFTKGAVPFKKFPVDDSDTWDAAAAVAGVAKWASSDGSGNKDKISFPKYRRAFCWFDEKNPNDLGSYKLPNCLVKDGKLVISKKGTEAAAAAIEGSRGQKPDIPETDLPAVKRRIERTYKMWKGTAPWADKPKHAEGDRVKIDGDGHGPGTVKANKAGKFVRVEFDDAKGKPEWHPEEDAKKHVDPDPKALADAILKAAREGVGA